MRKALTTTLAAVTAIGAVLATAAPAEAQRYRHYDRGHHRGGGDATAAAIIGGVAGLALGAAIAGNNDGRRDRVYSSGGYAYDPRYDTYQGGYYRDGPAYGYGERRYAYRTCVSRDRVYDPYIGRRVTIQREYAC
ncbi:MAG: hypothetical protein KKE02_14220 [Alphaproteobacteria bacterium]|nr:hypothetical protein [Alphaproteobacteria bacterium]MBU1513147.1 hypothetical protein [Alphaproteobacteria bacterium]MBU2095255.1 hypothetical protein [Alphaproteobacteria bacterium]MBU2152170.1 hypothetical protein [Alphaproteobacteria bacterium]MBU2306783.1 hypothetical protein [Alphaproteobacteria bacterium]